MYKIEESLPNNNTRCSAQLPRLRTFRSTSNSSNDTTQAMTPTSSGSGNEFHFISCSSPNNLILSRSRPVSLLPLTVLCDGKSPSSTFRLKFQEKINKASPRAIEARKFLQNSNDAATLLLDRDCVADVENSKKTSSLRKMPEFFMANEPMDSPNHAIHGAETSLINKTYWGNSGGTDRNVSFSDPPSKEVTTRVNDCEIQVLSSDSGVSTTSSNGSADNSECDETGPRASERRVLGDDAEFVIVNQEAAKLNDAILDGMRRDMLSPYASSKNNVEIPEFSLWKKKNQGSCVSSSPPNFVGRNVPFETPSNVDSDRRFPPSLSAPVQFTRDHSGPQARSKPSKKAGDAPFWTIPGEEVLISKGPRRISDAMTSVCSELPFEALKGTRRYSTSSVGMKGFQIPNPPDTVRLGRPSPRVKPTKPLQNDGQLIEMLQSCRRSSLKSCIEVVDSAKNGYNLSSDKRESSSRSIRPPQLDVPPDESPVLIDDKDRRSRQKHSRRNTDTSGTNINHYPAKSENGMNKERRKSIGCSKEVLKVNCRNDISRALVNNGEKKMDRAISKSRKIFGGSCSVSKVDAREILAENKEDIIFKEVRNSKAVVSKFSPAHQLLTNEDNFENFNGVKKECKAKGIRWKRGDQIGAGSFGKVFMGLNEHTGEFFAVKEISLMDGSQAEAEKLEAEINVMKSLHHKNIVRYIGTNTDKCNMYIFLEYIPGGSIASMLRRFGLFQEGLIRRFMYQIILGLQYLHSNGIMHCDIKGANVLVTEQGIAKLADFGCSKQLQGMHTQSFEESAHGIRGSIMWMAPEVVRQTCHGRSADIWSAGATMIEMGTASRPWPQFTNNFAALIHVANTTIPPPPPEHISTVARDFLANCMRIDPKERWKAVNLLEHPFLSGTGEEIEATVSNTSLRLH